jgi:leader peptidase (prepilin peptidase) / N-methyltransferase
MNEYESFIRIFAYPWGLIIAGIWGALWGSFFNVLIIRLPAEESVVRPASHCRACKRPIAWYDNVPLVSFLLLRGRCRYCGARFSGRYFLVELLVGLLSLSMYLVSVAYSEGPIGARLSQWVITSLFCGVLVAITFIDLDIMRIPDAITYPGIPIAVLLSLFLGHPHLWDGLLGAVCGYLSIRLIADGYQLLTGRAGMGYGDAKLLAMIGGLCGWQFLLPTLFLASLQGSLIGIPILLLHRGKNTEEEHDNTDPKAVPPSGLRHARIPFGPFLSLAALELLLLKNYLPLFFPYLY